MRIKVAENKDLQLSPEKIWSEYGKMIMKIAHGLSKKYNKPYDELLSEGMFGVLKKLPRWEPKRASLCTYIYRCSYFKMLDLCIKPLREIPMDVYNPVEAKNPFIQKEDKPNLFQKFLDELSEETRHLIKIIFEAPEELFEAIRPNKPKTSQKTLRNFMVDVMDWTTPDVNRAFAEVIECL